MSEPTNPPVDPSATGRLNGDGASHSVQDVESEDDGYASDAASLEEVRSEEFPTYFEERAGRLFPSTPSPYPLPVDTPEQEVSYPASQHHTVITYVFWSESG